MRRRIVPSPIPAQIVRAPAPRGRWGMGDRGGAGTRCPYRCRRGGGSMEGMVTVGSWVTVRDGEEEEEAWRVVDAADADLHRRLISREAPLARALLGHGPGDVIRVQTPGGARDV